MMESGPYRFSNVWKLKPYHLKASLMFLKRPSELTSFCRRSISVRVCGRVKRHSMASITRSDLPLGPQYNNLIHFTSSESMSSPCYSFGWPQCSFYGFNCFVLYWVCSNVLEKNRLRSPWENIDRHDLYWTKFDENKDPLIPQIFIFRLFLTEQSYCQVHNLF